MTEPDILHGVIADTDMSARPPRPIGPAVMRGAMGCCPACGNKTLFFRYLKVADRCASCSTELHHHRADDMPSWATILIVGHIVLPLIFAIEMNWQPPLWVHWITWPTLIVGLALFLLPRAKGAIVGLQWAMRLHGFARD